MAAARTPPRLLSVRNIETPCDGLIRVNLTGDLRGIPENKNGSHIKLFFPQEHQSIPVLPTLGANGVIWPAADEKPITRTYSVRHVCLRSQCLSVDFVDHSRGGIACRWAQRARPGDRIGMAGPGGPDPLLAKADWHILVGDMSAVPAISAIVETLDTPADVLVLRHGEGCLTSSIPAHVNVRYFSDRTPVDTVVTVLNDVISRRQSSFSVTGRCSAWVAGENKLVLQVRDFLRLNLGLTKRDLYAIPYWRRGQNEEQYHQARHTIMDAVW